MGYPPDLRWGTPRPEMGTPYLRWGTPDHVWMVGGTQGTPYLRWGTTPTRGSPPPPHYTEQHSEHFLRGGRCSSCVHAGGLSCSNFFLAKFNCKLELLHSRLCLYAFSNFLPINSAIHKAKGSRLDGFYSCRTENSQCNHNSCAPMRDPAPISLKIFYNKKVLLRER